VLAAGDVRQASVKRVASAVGEGAIAAQLVQSLAADERLSRCPRADGGSSASLEIEREPDAHPEPHDALVDRPAHDRHD
jgi:hypothetical protein